LLYLLPALLNGQSFDPDLIQDMSGIWVESCVLAQERVQTLLEIVEQAYDSVFVDLHLVTLG